MKITNVETVVVNASLRNWIFVKVTTDEPGLIGWGESSLEWKTQAVVGAVNDIAPLVIGEDPRRTEHLWQVMFRQQFFKGGIVTMSAISGIDQALHDIKAKDLGVPLYDLLGGAVRDKVRCTPIWAGSERRGLQRGDAGGFRQAGSSHRRKRLRCPEDSRGAA